MEALPKRHRGRTDLIGLEWLVNLLPVCEESQISSPLMSRLGKPAECLDYL